MGHRRLAFTVLIACAWFVVSAHGVAFAATGQPDDLGSTGSTAAVESLTANAQEPQSAESSETTLELVTSQVATFAPTYRMEDDHPLAVFGGAWRFRAGSYLSGLSARATSTKGAAATMAFSGTGAAVVGRIGPVGGKATVYLDGVATATVSTYATDYASGVILWQAAGLSPGTHTMRIVATGTRVVPSAGTWLIVDGWDIEGVPVAVGPSGLTRVQNGNKLLYTTTGWKSATRSTAYGRSAIHTSSKGAGVTLKFKGTSVAWYGRKSPDGGMASVYLDGKKVATVSQYASPTVEPRVAWAVTGLANKTHTVRIVCQGVPTVPGGGARTEFDAFAIKGTALLAPRPTPFRYPWRTYIVIDKSQYRLYLVKNKMLVASYPVAHGKSSTPTPSRVWRIDTKYPNTGGVYGPRKMRLFKGYKTSSGWRFVFSRYGIHGTNQPWVIGTKASHGCIRMYNKDVIELYPQVPLHTIVITRD